MKQRHETQALLRVPFDKCASAVPQALRTCGAAVSLGSCSRLLHGAVRFYCGESRTVAGLALQHQDEDRGNDSRLAWYVHSGVALLIIMIRLPRLAYIPDLERRKTCQEEGGPLKRLAPRRPPHTVVAARYTTMASTE